MEGDCTMKLWIFESVYEVLRESAESMDTRERAWLRVGYLSQSLAQFFCRTKIQLKSSLKKVHMSLFPSILACEKMFSFRGHNVRSDESPTGVPGQALVESI